MHSGIDTPEQRHVLVTVDARGECWGSDSVATTPTDWGAALQWARERGQR
jgi:hypothetical protein